MKALLSSLLLAFGCLGAAVAGPVTISQTQVGNVGTGEFSILWQVNDATVPGLDIFANSNGTGSLNGQLGVEFFPLEMNDVTVAQTAAQRTARRSLQAATQAAGIVMAKVTGAQPGTTYYLRPRSFDGAGSPNEAAAAALVPVTTAQRTGFVIESRQVRVSFDGCFANSDGLVVALSQANSAYPLFAVVGDHEQPGRGLFDLSDLLNAAGTTNATFTGSPEFTLQLVRPSAPVGLTTLQVPYSGNLAVAQVTDTTYVNSFPGLAYFSMEATSPPLQGQPFTFNITARASGGTVLTTYNEKVEVTTGDPGDLTSGGGLTANFTNGVLSNYEVVAANSGPVTFTATRPCGIETGTQVFTFSPPILDITFSAASYRVFQGAAQVTLTLTRASTDPAYIVLNTDNGTAQTSNPPFSAAVATGTPATSDYVDLTGAATNVSFAANETTKDVNVTLIPKTGTTLPNKRFTATISSPAAGATLTGAITTTTIEILANDTTNPTLTVTTPASTASTISAGSPYKVTGTAGDTRGLSKVEVILNGGAPVNAILGSQNTPTSIPFSLDIVPNSGANNLVVKAYDLRGNITSVTRNFSFIERYLLVFGRVVPPAQAATPDNAGTVAMVANPTANATPVKPTTANSDPKRSEIAPGTAVKLTATAKAGYTFSHWSNLPAGAGVLGNVATFNMPSVDLPNVTATFIVNPFGPPPGTGTSFYGLLHPSGGTSSSNATEGFLTGVLTSSSGMFTGRVLIDGLSQTFSANFYGNGSAVFTVGAVRQTSLTFGGTKTLTLSYDTNNDIVTGTVTDGANVSVGTAGRAIYSSTNKVPAKYLNQTTRGFFTIAYTAKAQNPPVDADTYPQGDGYGTITVSDVGVATFAGTLADGSTLTGSSALVAGDTCPMFIQLLTPGQTAVKGGSFGGVLTFDTAPADSDITATDLLWFRPAVTEVADPASAKAATELYTAGWPSGVKVDGLGALYNTALSVLIGLDVDGPSTGSDGQPLNFEDGWIHLTSGKLTSPIDKRDFIVSGNTITKIPSTDASYSLSPVATTGGFTGSFAPNWASPSTTKPMFKGIMLQKGASKGGYGYFLSNATGDADPESGHVAFKVQPYGNAMPALTSTAPPAIVSDLSPYVAKGTAGNARGLDRVEMVLNGGAVVEAALGTPSTSGLVPYSLNIAPVNGDNVLLITAYDLRGNATTVTINFHYTRRYVLTLSRVVPAGVAATPDSAGTVAMVATPTAGATALTPAAANTNPKTTSVVPNTSLKFTATPKAGYVFSHWLGLPGGSVELGNVATVTMPEADATATAVFVENPFNGPPGSGTGFFGLIHPAVGSSSTNATEGFFTGMLTASTGSFTGKVLIDGLLQNYTAYFYGNGSSTFNVGTSKYNSLTFGNKTLTLNYNADVITATVTDSVAVTTSVGAATRAIYSSTNKVPAAFLNASTTSGGPINKGNYTIAFPSKDQDPVMDATAYPQGFGFSSITLSETGAVNFLGTLADGTAISATSALVAGNACPFFAQITTPGAAATVKGGSFGGVVVFDTTPADSDVGGTDLLWFRPAVVAQTSPPATAAVAAATALYTTGWPNGIVVDGVGALYNNGYDAQTGLDLGPTEADGNGKLVFTDGNLNPDITKTNFNVSANAVTKIPSTDASFTLSLVQSTGGFSGTFAPNWASPAAAKPMFKGIMLQKGANRAGFGFFLSNANGDPDPESGSAVLSKQP